MDLRKGLLIGELCVALWPGAQPIALAEQSLTLAILIDNVAHIPRATLKRTDAYAANVLRRAGIGTRWLECSFQGAEHRDPPGCQLPLDVPVVIVRILPRAETQRWSLPYSSLGFCLNEDVYLLLPRLRDVAAREGLPVSLVLAHTLVHEIGHSLLGAGHAPERIMRGVLRTSEWRLAETGQLLFVSKDVQRLRDRIRELTVP